MAEKRTPYIFPQTNFVPKGVKVFYGLAQLALLSSVAGCARPAHKPWTFVASPPLSKITAYPVVIPRPALAFGTYSVLDLGKPLIPKLTRAQARWLRRIEESRKYRSRRRHLRFSMLSAPIVPLIVYDDLGDGNSTFAGRSYHVIGGPCRELFVPVSNTGPHILFGSPTMCQGADDYTKEDLN